MFRILGIIISDFFGLTRVCGIGVALRWLFAIATNFKTCMQTRNLQPADRAMGPGPFKARLGPARATLTGQQVISGIREIWVRNVYLKGGMLSIPPNATVVDLGANMGNFTVLALAHGPGVRCVSVEPDPRSPDTIKRNLATSGWADRAQVCTNFIGGKTSAQEELAKSFGVEGDGAGASFISEHDFIRRYDLQKIDLLKCDIEGSEFDLLKPGGLIFEMTEQMAVELHPWGGDSRAFATMLERQGFEVHTEARDISVILQAKRVRPRPARPDASAAAVAASSPAV